MNVRAGPVVLFVLLGAVPAMGQPAAAPGYGGGGAGLADPAGDGQGGMPHFTTPTAEYCAHLNREVARQGPGPDGTARALADEGARMCDRGQYRGGVVRLRRALALMRSGR
jgi:hypothetical protein